MDTALQSARTILHEDMEDSPSDSMKKKVTAECAEPTAHQEKCLGPV
jgi:hypothetical protein